MAQASHEAGVANGAKTQFGYRRHADQDRVASDIAEHPVVLLPQDTTELDFSHPKKPVEGSGPLSYEERTGFFQHVQLGVDRHRGSSFAQKPRRCVAPPRRSQPKALRTSPLRSSGEGFHLSPRH